MKLSPIFCAVIFCTTSIGAYAVPGASASTSETSQSLTSYRADVASTKLTLYQEGGAHVLESRDVRVFNSTNRIFFANLLGQFDENFNVYGEGILFTSIPNPSNGTSFLQNYEGKSIKFVELNQAGRGAVKNGTLVRVLDGDRYVIKFGNEIEMAPPGYLVLSDDGSLNQDKPSVGIKPQANTQTSTKQFELSYNIANLNWAAQYQIDLSDEFEAQKQVVFSGYVVVKNNNRLDIKDCDLSLVSGRGATLQNNPAPMYKMARAAVGAVMMQASMVESDSQTINAQSFQDRWMFDLPYKYTIGANATTKIQFFDKLVIPATKEYIFENNVWFDRWDGGDTFVSPNVLLHFDNQAKIGERGIGLPAGRVSVFDAKTKKFLSESFIQDSPSGTKLDITLNPAFDVVAKRYQTEYELLPAKKVADKANGTQTFNVAKASFKMALENRSAIAKTIKVIDRFDVAGFQIKSSNQTYKIENNRVVWEILVEANSKSELTYTAILQRPL